MHIALHVKYPLFLIDLNKTLIFSGDFSNNIQILNFIKILSVGAELFHATEGQTHMMNLVVVLRNFSKVPKSYKPKKLLKLRRSQSSIERQHTTGQFLTEVSVKHAASIYRKNQVFCYPENGGSKLLRNFSNYQ